MLRVREFYHAFDISPQRILRNSFKLRATTKEGSRPYAACLEEFGDDSLSSCYGDGRSERSCIWADCPSRNADPRRFARLDRITALQKRPPRAPWLSVTVGAILLHTQEEFAPQCSNVIKRPLHGSFRQLVAPK